MDFILSDGIAVLRRTPLSLRELLNGLPSSWTHTNEGAETWSPYVVVGHLLHADQTNWIQRSKQILDQKEPLLFQPFDRFAQLTSYNEVALSDLLDAFVKVRSENIAILEGWQLTEEKLGLEGEHPEFGTVTLRQLLATWVAHDLSHLSQIVRVMAYQYTNAVGPWRVNLSVMR